MGNERNGKLFGVIISIASAISLMLVSWCFSTVICHEKALAKVPTEFPPQWFQDKVGELDSRLKDVTKKVEVNNETLIRLEVGVQQIIKQTKP